MSRLPNQTTPIALNCPAPSQAEHDALSDQAYDLKLDELDRLLNDPDSPMDPSKVWSLLAEVAQDGAAASPSSP